MPRRAPLIAKSNREGGSKRRVASNDSGGIGEILIEFVTIGNSIKVMAVDPVSGLEVAITGPTTASKSDLERVVCRKLLAKLEKQNGTQQAAQKRGKLI